MTQKCTDKLINFANGPERLFGLDAARGVASLIVVLQHWPQHFWLVPGFNMKTADLPLFALLKPFYTEGARAVSFFFVLSGFIFYWLYAKRIHERKVSLVDFAIFRLARLYPLHLLTLLLVAFGQWRIHRWLGRDFVYEWNDAKHFLLNVALIQNWGVQNGYSWNGPSWSISVEIGLYIVFFISCRLLRPSLWQALAMLFATWLLAPAAQIFSSAVPFFAGGICYGIWRTVRSTWTYSRHSLLLLLTITAWRFGFLLSDTEFSNATARYIADIAGGGRWGTAVTAAVHKLLQRQFDIVIFPLTVLTAALSEQVFTKFPWRRLNAFGNLSFGIYLLHFPLQIAFVCWALSNGVDAGFFVQPSTMTVFFVVLILLSVLSYTFFERPTMDLIRSAWRRRKSR